MSYHGIGQFDFSKRLVLPPPPEPEPTTMLSYQAVAPVATSITTVQASIAPTTTRAVPAPSGETYTRAPAPPPPPSAPLAPEVEAPIEEELYEPEEVVPWAPDPAPSLVDRSRPECLQIPPPADCMAPCPEGMQRDLTMRCVAATLMPPSDAAENGKFPWLWVVLGVAGLGTVGYLMMRD